MAPTDADEMTNSTPKSLAFFVGAIAYLGWASTWPVGKIALETWTPLGITTIRHTVSGILLIVLSTQMGEKPRLPNLLEIYVGTLQFGCYYIFAYMALHTAPVTVIALAAGAYPVLVAAIGRDGKVAFGIKITALSLSLAGLGIVAFGYGSMRQENSILSPALLLAIIAAVSMALGSIAPRRAVSFPRVINFLGLSMLCGAVFTGALMLTLGEPFASDTPGGKAIFSAVWLTLIGTALVFLFLEWLIRHYPPWKVTFGYTLVPGLAALMSFAILGENVNSAIIFGLLVSTTALGLVTIRNVKI